MSRYLSQYLILDVSDDWIDQSLIAFKIPARPGRGDCSFVVTNDPTRSGKKFEEYLLEQQKNCERTLPGFQIVRSELMEAHGRAMGWLEFTWQGNESKMQIRQVMFDCDPIAVICTLTGAPKDVPLVDQSWRQLMSSLEFPASEPSDLFQPQPRST